MKLLFLFLFSNVMLTCNEIGQTNYSIKAYYFHSNPTGRFPDANYKKEYSFRILISHPKNIVPDSIDIRFNKMKCENITEETGETPYVYTYHNGFREQSKVLIDREGNHYNMVVAKIPNHFNPRTIDEKVEVSFLVNDKKITQQLSFEELAISVKR